jgi:hypothetical protein
MRAAKNPGRFTLRDRFSGRRDMDYTSRIVSGSPPPSCRRLTALVRYSRGELQHLHWGGCPKFRGTSEAVG